MEAEEKENSRWLKYISQHVGSYYVQNQFMKNAINSANYKT